MTPADGRSAGLARLRALVVANTHRLGDLVRWCRGRTIGVPAGATTFRYGKELNTFLTVMLIVTAVETIVVEITVPWLWLRVVLGVLAIGGLPLMAGMVAALRVRPHVLHDGSLLVRSGGDLEAVVPLSRIASIAATIGSAPRKPGRQGTVLQLAVGGNANVVITLVPPVAQSTGATAADADANANANANANADDDEITQIRCTADDPAAMAAAVRAHLRTAVTTAD